MVSSKLFNGTDWTEWKPYDACTVTCGNGTRARTRQCMQDGVESQSCSGSSQMEEECSFEPCKGKPTNKSYSITSNKYIYCYY